METLSKLIDLLKSIIPSLIGFFVAKQDSKIDSLKSENKTLKEFDKIDKKEVDEKIIFDSNSWK